MITMINQTPSNELNRTGWYKSSFLSSANQCAEVRFGNRSLIALFSVTILLSLGAGYLQGYSSYFHWIGHNLMLWVPTTLFVALSRESRRGALMFSYLNLSLAVVAYYVASYLWDGLEYARFPFDFMTVWLMFAVPAAFVLSSIARGMFAGRKVKGLAWGCLSG